MQNESGPGDLAKSMWRYRSALPFSFSAEPVTLGEGLTPLIRSRLFPGATLFWKDETRNPTGSHKDRPLSVAATDAIQYSATTMVVVSAGSTGLSNAAYAARAGLRSISVMGRGAPRERVFPLRALGSRLIEVDADIDELFAAVTALHGHQGLYVASTTRAANPVQAEASRTIAYELVDELGREPDILVVPVGGGGTLSGIHKGFVQLRHEGVIKRLPRLIAVVPKRYDTLERAFRSGVIHSADFFAMPRPIGGPTVLNKIAHAHPPDGVEALQALVESGGEVYSFDDSDAVRAVHRIGMTDGLYFEPSTAIVLPALASLHEAGELGGDTLAVVLGCGSGFRETTTILDSTSGRVELAPLKEMVERLMDQDAPHQ